MLTGELSLQDFAGPAAPPPSGGSAPVSGASSGSAAPEISFTDFAKPAATSGPPKQTGFWANVGAGTSDAVAGTLGAPVDLTTGALNLGSRGINYLTGSNIPPITKPVGGSDFFRTAQGYIGADPRTVDPADDAEQLGRAAGSGIASMLSPWSVARSLPVLSGIAGGVQGAVGAGSASQAAAIGAASGVGGQMAGDAAPDGWKPIANFGGQLAGGGLAIGTTAAARAALGAATDQFGQYIAPMRQAGQTRLAGQRIASAATDLPMVQDTLANPPSPLVPGSQPTTAQLTGDPGLGNLERSVARGNPDAFADRAAQQNVARVGALQSLAPEDASPAAVGAAFRQQLDSLDTALTNRVDTVRANAQNATQGLGGAVPTGADAQTTALQAYGQNLRSGLDNLNMQARNAVSGLYRDVDPDGTLAVPMTPIKEAATSIMSSVPKNAAPMAGDARGIFGVAQLLPATQPFAEVAALRSRITDAMRSELYDNGRSQTYGRLTNLLASVDDTLQSGVARQASQDPTMLGRLQERVDSGPTQLPAPDQVQWVLDRHPPEERLARLARAETLSRQALDEEALRAIAQWRLRQQLK